VLITSEQITNDLGYRSSWISARLKTIAKDYVINRHIIFDVYDCIVLAENYECNSKNQAQKKISESMMKKLLKYLKGLK